MVLTTFRKARTLPDLFDSFFLNWPDSPKPPIDSFPIPNPTDKTSLDGWEIQMALAGFTENDVKVWHDGHVLNINGSNRNNQEIADKFTCEFSHSIAISKNLELSKAEVSLINGILSIKIPINKDKTKKNFLFGRDDKSLLTDGK